MTDQEKALELRREYMRNWRAKNREKVRQQNEAYWLRKAMQLNHDTRCNYDENADN